MILYITATIHVLTRYASEITRKLSDVVRRLVNKLIELPLNWSLFTPTYMLTRVLGFRKMCLDKLKLCHGFRLDSIIFWFDVMKWIHECMK